MTESTGVMAWAKAKLIESVDVLALVSTRVYDGLAPQVPLQSWTDHIILSQQSYNEVGTSADGVLGGADVKLIVKAVTQYSGYATAEAIYAAAHAALQGATGNVSGAVIKQCVREAGIRYFEIPDGVRYNHLGGMYCVICIPA